MSTIAKPQAPTLKPVEQDIIKRIEALCGNSDERFLVALEGGHFSTMYGADEFTIQSQRSAFRVAEEIIRLYSKRAKVVFGVLADDLGQVCSAEENVCTVALPSNKDQKVEIPKELHDELIASSLYKPEKLIFLSEKTARNRGIQFLRKYTKKHEYDIKHGGLHLSFEEDDVKKRLFFTASDNQRIAVADVIDGWQWSSFCPLIMAQHYADLQANAIKLFSGPTKHILLDFSFIDDRNKVNKGAELSQRTYPNMTSATIINVCFGDDEGDMYTIDEHAPVKAAK